MPTFIPKTCLNCSREIAYRQSRRGLCPACYQSKLRRGRFPLKRDQKGPASTPIRYGRKQWEGEIELELLRVLLLKNFWAFYLFAFGDGRSPKGKKWIDPRIHKPLADWLQFHADEWMEWRRDGIVQQKHLAILIHREMGKSRMISAAFQLWLHLRDPEFSSATGSEDLKLSGKILTMMKGVLDGSDPNSLFTRMFGNWESSSRQWSGQGITHAMRKQTSRADPSLFTFGVETSITGSHPDGIFYDDPISYEKMRDDSEWLDKVNSQVSSIIPVLQSDGIQVFVGTRYDDQDHFGVAFRDEGVATLAGMETDSIQLDPNGKYHVYFLAGRDAAGKPTSPKVWPEWRLMQFQKKHPLRYASQIMNDPEVSEFNPITKQQIKDCLIPASKVPWSAMSFGISTDIAFWDGKSREKKDDCVIIVHGYPKDGSGDVYVIEVHASPTWRAEDFGHRLVSIVQRYRRQGRRIKGISGDKPVGGMGDGLQVLLRNFFHDANEPMPAYFEYARGGEGKPDKIQRIVAAAGFWVDGHVRVVEGAPGIQLLMDQMAKIGQFMVKPRLRNDAADAHSDAFKPEFYQPMRRSGSQRAPYDRGSEPMEVPGLNTGMFDDSEVQQWMDECPREPIR